MLHSSFTRTTPTSYSRRFAYNTRTKTRPSWLPKPCPEKRKKKHGVGINELHLALSLPSTQFSVPFPCFHSPHLSRHCHVYRFFPVPFVCLAESIASVKCSFSPFRNRTATALSLGLSHVYTLLHLGLVQIHTILSDFVIISFCRLSAASRAMQNRPECRWQ